MSDKLQFVLAIFAIVLVWGVFSLKGVDKKEYFKSSDGRGILKGIVLAIVFAVLFVTLSTCVQAGAWFNDASVYAGLESTKKINPMCVQGDPDDKTGSNLGLILNIYIYI